MIHSIDVNQPHLPSPPKHHQVSILPSMCSSSMFDNLIFVLEPSSENNATNFTRSCIRYNDFASISAGVNCRPFSERLDFHLEKFTLKAGKTITLGDAKKFSLTVVLHAAGMAVIISDISIIIEFN